MNVRKLRAKMVENAVSVEMLSNLIGTSKSTFYRKLTNKGEDFTVGGQRNCKSTGTVGGRVHGNFFCLSCRISATKQHKEA